MLFLYSYIRYSIIIKITFISKSVAALIPSKACQSSFNDKSDVLENRGHSLSAAAVNR
jgi:hypothetical protein